MKNILIMSIMIALGLYGCALRQTPEPQTTPPANPQADKATLVGRLVDAQTGDHLVNLIGRLASVIREGDGGFFILDLAQSPGANVDPNGYFIFENVDPEEYVLTIGYGENIADYVTVQNSDGTAKVWSTQAGQIIDMGTIRITYPAYRPTP